MSDTTEFDVLIIGAGLAGSLCAQNLASTNLRIGIVDHHQPGVGASSNPATLLNPIPGATLNPKPGTLEAHAFTTCWLQSLPQDVRAHITTDLKLLRPFNLNTRSGRRLHRSFEESAELIRSHISAELLDQSALQRTYPLLEGCDGAVLLGDCATAPISILLSHLHQTLSRESIPHLSGRLTQLIPESKGWRAETTLGTLRAERIVLASGAGLSNLFDNLPFQQTAGHLAVVKLPKDFPKAFAVSGRGHLAPLRDGTWSLGSTYHQEESPEPTTAREVLALLLENIGTWVPRLKEAQIVHTWRGVRGVFPPERQPLVGPVPGSEGLFVLGGFASRGLQWIPWAAHTLSEHLRGQPLDIPETIASSRLSHEFWTL